MDNVIGTSFENQVEKLCNLVIDAINTIGVDVKEKPQFCDYVVEGDGKNIIVSIPATTTTVMFSHVLAAFGEGKDGEIADMLYKKLSKHGYKYVSINEMLDRISVYVEINEV